MALLTQQQVTTFAANAGFSGDALKTIVAIAQAESGEKQPNGVILCDTNAHNPGNAALKDIEDSWGVWQINLLAHHDVTVADATDPTFAAKYAFSIYTKDHNTFIEWGTYTDKSYKNTPAWKNWSGTPAPTISPTSAWSLTDSMEVWPWITRTDGKPAINNPYHSSFESGRGAVQDGVGIAVALDVPVTSLTSGTVMAAEFGADLNPNWNYGGFIVVRSNIPGIGIADVFYRHMDRIDVKKDATVVVGQELGLSGGQTKGGLKPESPQFTTGAHIDVGINPVTLPYSPVGKNQDPTQWLTNLIANGPPARDRLHLIIGNAGGGSPAATTAGNLAQGAVLLSDQLAQGTGAVPGSFLSIEQGLDTALVFVPIDWSTITSGTHWWDYVLPWQWSYAQKTDAANVAKAVEHNAAAGLGRTIFILLGLALILATFFSITTSIGKAADEYTGFSETAGKAVDLAASAAGAAAVAA